LDILILFLLAAPSGDRTYSRICWGFNSRRLADICSRIFFSAAIAADLAASIMYAIAASYAKRELADVSSLTIAL
jgi:hypothetical protein